MEWNLSESFFINTSFSLLLIGLVINWSSLAFPGIKNLNKIGIACTILTNLCLFIILLSRWIFNKYFPLSNLYESLLFLTWSLTFINVILEYQNIGKIISSINIPVCLFVITFASFTLPSDMQQASPLIPALRSNWLMMHVTIMMLSYATLIIGSLLSILFLILANNNEIKLQGSSIQQFSSKSIRVSKFSSNSISTNNINLKSKLSLLESIDNLSYRTIGLGFPLLTIGIISGAVWANEAWGSYWSWDPKETWALVTWLIFASYLHSRFTQSWRGKKPAILASAGFFVVWICYLGVNFLGKGLHSYGWLL